MKQTKIIQIGCGKMSVFTMRYAIEKGAKIIAGFDIDKGVIGKDIAEIIGEKKPMKVKVYNISELDTMIKKLKPDVAIVTTMSLFADCYDVLLTCAKNGVNAITTCEEAFFPMNSSPEMTKEIDRVAKENNCTISGSGYQDASWGSLITTLCSTTQKIVKIKGRSSYNVEDYGIALAKAHGAGLTAAQFESEVAAADNVSESVRKKLIEKGDFLPSYMWNVNGWLCDALGLTVKAQTQKCIPQIASKDLKSSTLNMTVKKGMARGMSAVVTTTTKEGITIESECVGMVYTLDEFDSNEWTLIGEPNTTMTINKPSTVELTCASVINRIPDLIDAKPGYIPTSQMGTMKFQFKI